MMKSKKLPVFALLLLCGFTSTGQISPMLQQRMLRDVPIPVFVEFREQADFAGWKAPWDKNRKAGFVLDRLQSVALRSQSTVRRKLDAWKAPYLSFYLVNALRAELSPWQIRDLAGHPEILQIAYDSPQSFHFPARDEFPALAARGPEFTWGLERMGVAEVWDQGIRGQHVVVADADTGVRWDIPALRAQYRGNQGGAIEHRYNWYDAIHAISPLSNGPDNPCGLDLQEPCDDHGHGTHTAGTMAGSIPDLNFGVAPDASWVGCRNMERGNGAPSTYLECFEFFLAPFDFDRSNPQPSLAPHVINNSWYCSLEEGCDTAVFPAMERAVLNLRISGVVVVVSAGNDGAHCSTLSHVPAIYDKSFTVGSIRKDDSISSFSSNGPVINYGPVRIKPNVVAPGSDVVSMLPDSSLASWSGTSMAGPHAAGLVALIISANPALEGQVEEIESIIERSAVQHIAPFDCWPSSGTDIPNNTFGHGVIHAGEAVRLAKNYVGNTDPESERWSLLPNPSYGYIVLEREFDEPVLVSVHTSTGQVMLRELAREKRWVLETANWPTGLYFFSGPGGRIQPFVVVE
jgi:subtilisin family serine protease